MNRSEAAAVYNGVAARGTYLVYMTNGLYCARTGLIVESASLAAANAVAPAAKAALKHVVAPAVKRADERVLSPANQVYRDQDTRYLSDHGLIDAWNGQMVSWMHAGSKRVGEWARALEDEKQKGAPERQQQQQQQHRQDEWHGPITSWVRGRLPRW